MTDTKLTPMEIVTRLTRGLPILGEYEYFIDRRNLEVAEDEEFATARVDFDDVIKRAKIWIDENYPDWRETYTLEEVIGHELGHVFCGEKPDMESIASRVGKLLIWIANERRANGISPLSRDGQAEL